GDKVAGIHPERVLAGGFPDRGLVLTGVIAACRPAGAGWEADLQVAEATITCRLADRPPVADGEFTVTALDPPYFDQNGGAVRADGGVTRPEQVHR
ncbi:MAG: hypothetical protein ACLQB1_16495, partial [Streptosporangiaceae bacterium]